MVDEIVMELKSVEIELSKHKLALEDKNDFIIWLFEESEQLNHTTFNEMWSNYEIYLQNK